MGKKEDGTVEQAISKSKEVSPEKQIMREIIAKHAIKDEVSIYSILKKEYQIWVKEQVENSDGKLSGDEWSEEEFIKKCTKKFKVRLEKILYEGVVDECLRSPKEKGIRLPKEAKESVLFLVGLGDAGKIYQEELSQLVNGKAISGDALNYISRNIQLIFLHKKGMVSKVQRHINMTALPQTQEMISKFEEFYKIICMAGAITDVDAYETINSAMDKCNEIIKDTFTTWCMDEKELPKYDSWIRGELRQEYNDKNPFSYKAWKNDTSYDILEDIDE